jgi:pyruvate dehydrogenase E2 component (dihydrolipoyllysine-residue acetyltransferase)
MPFEVALPRLGWNMETGRVGEWLKKDGEHVKAGEILFTVEGDKATQEVEALESGILRIPLDSPPPGQEVPVGTVLGYLLAPGEEIEAVPRPRAVPPDSTSRDLGGSRELEAGGAQVAASGIQHPATSFSQTPSRFLGPGQPPPMGREPAISPRARRVALELGIDWTGLKGSGRTGRIVERDVRQAVADLAALKVSPLARRLAAELGVDLEALATRMPGRRIERADIEAEAKRMQAEKAMGEAAMVAAPATLPPLRPAVPAPSGAVLPVSTVRRMIADRLAASARTVAAVTLTTEADATELVLLRKQLKDDSAATGQPVPSYNDLLAKLSAQALMEHPMVNARFDGDFSESHPSEIVQSATANIGVAVDTDRGLLVPVLLDVQTKSLRQIARESAALIEKARSGRISPDDLHGGTFTITNLGMYDIDAFTPIINLPECAILGVGRIVPKQVVVDAETERVAIRHMVFLSLTFDHRLVDGAPAARFLQRVKQFVENPYLWLAG